MNVSPLRGPVVVLYSAEVPVDGTAELTPLFLSLFMRSSSVQRLYCTRWSPAPPSAQVVLTQPVRLLCPACYRAYPTATAAGSCDLCGTPLAANPLSEPSTCDPGILAQAQADLRTPGVAVLLLGHPEDPTLSAILAARDPAVTPLVAVGASLEEEGLEGPADQRIPGSMAEGVQAVAAALGLSEGLARALAAAEAEAEGARAAGAAAGALPPTPASALSAAAEEASVQHTIQAALAAAALSDPCSMQPLQALAAGGRSPQEETEEDAKFFSAGSAEEAQQAAPHAEAAPAFFFTEEGEGESDSDSSTSGENSEVE
jgi:hypothetical protein